MKKTLLFVAALALLGALPAQAQFGKNLVVWEHETWSFYRSAHFDFYVAVDLKREDVQPHFTELVAHLEGSYEFLTANFRHKLMERPIVVLSRTHSQFESLRIAEGTFMPEGVGAYAFPRGTQLIPGSDLVLVIKPDFLPVLNKTICTHELTHIFQFDMIGWNFFRSVLSGGPQKLCSHAREGIFKALDKKHNRPILHIGGAGPEAWSFEATADYMANIYAPYSRDDIRRMSQRTAAANTQNPQFGLPTLKMLREGQADAYSDGSMVFEFLETRFGRPRTLALIVSIFKDRGLRFQELLANISQGEFSSDEAFDRAQRDFWSARYAEDSRKRPQPYAETASAKGRQILPIAYPYPMTSPVVSPSGLQIAYLTYSHKNGIVLAIAPALPRETPSYNPYKKERRHNFLGIVVEKPAFEILTKQMPPKPYEYIVAQNLGTWPFNGSDIGWWQDTDWLAQVQKARDEAKLKPTDEKLAKALANAQKAPGKSKLAFFARYNRDHALFIVDANTGKVLQRVELKLDQAFSPKFSPDGTAVYFSAADNIDRHIYRLELATGNLNRFTTDGAFNSAPAVAPDGTRLAYVAFVGDFQKLFLLDLATGTKQQLTWGRYNDNSPSWSSDGKLLAYTSDERDGIWNLYTLEVDGLTSKQWTEFYGGVFTPSFLPGENDRIVVSTYIGQDQYRNYVYPNFELFDIRLKEPLRTVQLVPTDDNMQLALRPERLVAQQLDQRQLEHPQKPPSRWQLDVAGATIGASGYYGMFGYSRFLLRDILNNRIHSGVYVQSGDFRVIDYTFIDQSQRWVWAINLDHYQYPLFYPLVNFQGQHPKYPHPDGDTNQFTLNNVWAREFSATFYAQYPFNKWERVEFGIRPRYRSYTLPYRLETDTPLDGVPPSDLEYYNFFTRSDGKANIGLTAAFVHDTALYSYETLGPLHGSVLRAQLEYGPGLSSSSPQYATASVDARKYQRISNSALVAVRLAGMASTRPNGDFLLLGGTDGLRGYPYFSVAGNQVGYGSAELRLPLANVVAFGSIPFQLRGELFSDYAVARFSQSQFATRHEWSYGFGLQAYLFLPMKFEWAKTKFAPDKWNFNFGIGFSF